jgi:hypothetical protein
MYPTLSTYVRERQPMTATTDSVSGAVDVFLQFGALGAFAVISIAFYNRAWKDTAARAERAETALADLNREVRDKVVPVLAQAMGVLKEAERAMAHLTDRR